MSDYTYDAVIVSVHDADTIKCDVDLGFSCWRRESFRLFGINAPELNTPDGKAAAKEAKRLLPVGAKVVLETVKDKTEKYGRMLALVIVPGKVPLNINDHLVAKGFAKPWDGKGARPV